MHDSITIPSIERTEILPFGKLREIFKANSVQWPRMKDTDALKFELFRLYPVLKELPFLIAVNKELVHNNTVIHPGDIVALLPPYAGG